LAGGSVPVGLKHCIEDYVLIHIPFFDSLAEKSFTLHADVEKNLSSGGISSHVVGADTIQAELLEAES
jgi:hypothetical protein